MKKPFLVLRAGRSETGLASFLVILIVCLLVFCGVRLLLLQRETLQTGAGQPVDRTPQSLFSWFQGEAGV